MKSINWNNYTSSDFQLFCNAFLSFEIGKAFQPFGATGRDGGIDGSFKGKYADKEGEWRFQYKHHTTVRRPAVQSLKTEIKNEAVKLKNENFFVLLTNVQLLPQEYGELINIYQEAKPAGVTADIEIWDGAKILALSLRYPLLWLWLEEGFTSAQVVDYRTAFNKELSGSISNVFTFANRFAYRQDKLNERVQFKFSPVKRPV